MNDLIQRLREALGGELGNSAADALEAKNKELAELEDKYIQTHNWLIDRNEEIAKIRYTNTIMYGTSHPEIYKNELDYAKETIEAKDAEIARLRALLEDAADLVEGDQGCTHSDELAEEIRQLK